MRGPALSWEDLATAYDANNGGRKARTLPMDQVFEWAQKRPEYEVDEVEGTIHEARPQ